MSFMGKRQEEKIIYGRKSMTGLVLLLCGAIMIVASAYQFFSSGGINEVIVGVGFGCFIYGAIIYNNATKELAWIKQQEDKEATEKYQ